MKTFLLIICLCCSSAATFAKEYVQEKVTIGRLGSHSGQVFYISLREGFSTDCAWGNLYCSETNPNCKNYLSILLSAKATAKPIQVNYEQASSGEICTVNLVMFE